MVSSEADVGRGLVGSVLGMKVQASTLVPDGTAYVIDARVVAVLLFRRDVLVDGWGDPWAGEFGVKASDKVWLGCVRKQRNCKND